MEDDTLFPRHVHYTILTKDKVWSTNIGTYEITCKIPFETMKQIQEKRTYIIMNALSKESYDEAHIPNSILCHHESLEEGLSNKQKKTGILKQLIKQNEWRYPPVKKFIKDVGDIKQVPIVVYCANSTCDASDKLKEHLYSCGFFNVIEYPGGMKEWLQKSNTTSLFEDAAASEEEEELEEELEEEETEDGDTEFNEDEEIYVYDDIEYIHKLDGSDEILDEENTVVGTLVGGEIVWNSTSEHKKHMDRINAKGSLGLDDDEGDQVEDTNDEDTEDENGDDEEQDDGDDKEQADETPLTVETSEEEEDSSEEHTESSLNSQNTTELKRLFDKVNNMKKKAPKKKKDLIQCILKCENRMKGGGPNDSILYGGGVTQSMYENSFRGWGFTFNM